MTKPSRMPLTRKRRPTSGSLAAFVFDYKAVGFPEPQARELAKLAYTQATILKRLELVEAVQLGVIFGMVEVDGARHLVSCSKRQSRHNECTCGATPRGTTESAG